MLRDGKEQPVARAERARREDKPWTAVVWLDDLLAAPANLANWAQLLGEQAKDLATLGSVEIVLADPLPRVALAATSDVGAIKAALESAGPLHGPEHLPGGRSGNRRAARSFAQSSAASSTG